MLIAMQDVRKTGWRSLPALLGLLAALSATAAVSRVEASQVFAHAKLTLRNGPGERFPGLNALDPGSKLDVLWCNAADWCLLQHGDLQGWVPLASLEPTKDVGNGKQPPASAGAAAVGAQNLAGTAVGTPASNAAGSASPAGAAVSVSVPGVSVNVNVP